MVQIISLISLVFTLLVLPYPTQAVPLTLHQICSMPDKFLSPTEKLKCQPVRQLWKDHKDYNRSVDKANEYKIELPSEACFRYFSNIKKLHNQYLINFQEAYRNYQNHDENFALINLSKMEILSYLHTTLLAVALNKFEGGYIENRITSTNKGLQCIVKNRDQWISSLVDRQVKMDKLRDGVLNFIAKKYKGDTVFDLFKKKEESLRNLLKGRSMVKQTMLAITSWHVLNIKKILIGIRIAASAGAMIFAGDDFISNKLKSLDIQIHKLSDSPASHRIAREAIRSTQKTLDEDTYRDYLDSTNIIISAAPQYDIYLQMFEDIENIRNRSNALSNEDLEAAKLILK